MRATPLATLTAATALAVLAPLVPAVAATDSNPPAWLGFTCEMADVEHLLPEDAPTSSTTVLHEPLAGLRPVTVTAQRFTYANGSRCDVVRLDGRLPFRRELRSFRTDTSDRGQLVVAGVDQGEVELHGYGLGSGGNVPIRGLDHLVIGAIVYAPTESGTFPDVAAYPDDWRDQPYSYTHTRTTVRARIAGRVGERERFRVTAATRAAAARRLERDLGAATNPIDRRAARKTYRLALHGVRLAMKPFVVRWSGELPG